MKWFELVVAAVFAALGVRAAVRIARQPFVGEDLTDHLLYAMHVTGRVGLWFTFALIFLVFGTSDAQGRAFGDEMRDQRWLLGVVLVMGALQFLGGYFLSRRGGRADRGPSPEGPGP
jgi:hypothetical protein